MIKQCLNLFTQLIAKTRINYVDQLNYCKKDYVCKRRRRFSAVFLCFANSILAIIQSRAQFLHLYRWQHRERDLYYCLYNEHVFIDTDKRIYLKKRTGLKLSDFLDKKDVSLSDKYLAIKSATESLIRLHMSVLPHIDQKAYFQSHGDATVNNVIYDPDKQLAQWIDFETVHRNHLTSLVRHADDLRAFIFSILAHFNPRDYSHIISIILTQYTEQDTKRTLYRIIKKERFEIIFHLAQTRLSLDQYRQVKRCLLNQKELVQFQTEEIKL